MFISTEVFVVDVAFAGVGGTKLIEGASAADRLYTRQRLPDSRCHTSRAVPGVRSIPG